MRKVRVKKLRALFLQHFKLSDKNSWRWFKKEYYKGRV